jgi:hypothetical protein
MAEDPGMPDVFGQDRQGYPVTLHGYLYSPVTITLECLFYPE